MLKKIKKNKIGFTLFEVVVSIFLFTIVILLTGSMYSLSQKSYNKGSNRGELIQNARVSLDRMTRELRQSVNIVTVLPLTEDEEGNPPANEIFFQDGHDISQINYLRYYLDGSDLKRSKIIYYFDSEPEVYVTYDSVDQLGDLPEELIIEDRIVGEYFDLLEYWGGGGLIYISEEFLKGLEEFNIRTSVFSRN